MYYVGIDWADQKHNVAIVDEQGNVIGKNLTIAKNHHGFEKLADTLRKLSPEPEEFEVGIETPHNVLVDFLIELHYPVYAIFPGNMKSFRKRYRPSGARDDQIRCLCARRSPGYRRYPAPLAQGGFWLGPGARDCYLGT